MSLEAVPGEKERGAANADRVFHVTLSLGPDEGALSDEAWARAAHMFVEEMGFVNDSSGAADCNWFAVHHGRSKAGNDHIHIAVNLVREDGRRANIHQSKMRTAKAGAHIAQTLGKQVAFEEEASRSVGSVPRVEWERARQEQREADRTMLRRRLAAAAWQAESEADFVRVARGMGVLVRPRYATGTSNKVTGYSVALGSEHTKNPIWFAPSKLDRSLSLPALRASQEWRQPGEETLAAWQGSDSAFPAEAIQVETPDAEDLETLCAAFERETQRRLAKMNRTIELAEPAPVRTKEERVALTTALRDAAARSTTEAEFVRAVRETGVLLRPRYAASGSSEITGYSVALDRGSDRKPVWFAPSKLDRSLSLPALRVSHQWDGADAEAAKAWQENNWRTPSGRTRQETMWAREVSQARRELSEEAGYRWRRGAADLSGMLGQWSIAVEGPKGGSLGRASDALARAVAPPRGRKIMFESTKTMLVMSRAGSRKTTRARLALMMQAIKTVDAYAKLAQANRDRARASQELAAAKALNETMPILQQQQETTRRIYQHEQRRGGAARPKQPTTAWRKPSTGEEHTR
ncbi:relaxase/mobilization nuclease domain-containing protein [Dermabacteraceae bacterium P13115]